MKSTILNAANRVLYCAILALAFASLGGTALADIGPGGAVPEIGIGAMGAALTLLTGGLILIRERSRSK